LLLLLESRGKFLCVLSGVSRVFYSLTARRAFITIRTCYVLKTLYAICIWASVFNTLLTYLGLLITRYTRKSHTCNYYYIINQVYLFFYRSHKDNCCSFQKQATPVLLTKRVQCILVIKMLILIKWQRIKKKRKS